MESCQKNDLEKFQLITIWATLRNGNRKGMQKRKFHEEERDLPDKSSPRSHHNQPSPENWAPDRSYPPLTTRLAYPAASGMPCPAVFCSPAAEIHPPRRAQVRTCLKELEQKRFPGEWVKGQRWKGGGRQLPFNLSTYWDETWPVPLSSHCLSAFNAYSFTLFLVSVVIVAIFRLRFFTFAIFGRPDKMSVVYALMPATCR